MKLFLLIWLLVLLPDFAEAQIPPFGTNSPCTNCPIYVNSLTNDPVLHFESERRVQHYGTTYSINGWHWDFAPDTNAIVVYDVNGNVTQSLSEPNGSGNIGVLSAWQIQPHASNQIVGVIDDSIQLQHGLLVSSCIAQPGGDGSNTVGVARHVQLHQKDFGGDTVISNRIWELVQEGATVINMSFGWSGRIPPVKTINAMRDNPEAIFTVAGANANWNIDYPTNYDALCQCQLPNVICVAASTKADEKMNPGIWGTNVFGYAPGRRIVVETYPWTASNAVLSLSFSAEAEPLPDLRAVFYESGSSFSAPKVAGIVALLKEHRPAESRAEIVERLAAGCEQVGSLAGLSRFGRFNAFRSMIWTRTPRLFIDPVTIFAACGLGSNAVVEASSDLISWIEVTNIVGTGFPSPVASVPTNGNKFFRIRHLEI